MGIQTTLRLSLVLVHIPQVVVDWTAVKISDSIVVHIPYAVFICSLLVCAFLHLFITCVLREKMVAVEPTHIEIRLLHRELASNWVF